MPGEVTLREFMELRFKNLEKKVDSLEKKVDALEAIISNDVKHAIKMWRYIGGLVVAIVVALTVAYLRQRLGL
jgi:tetrahydromethanopterin S-methyltransferase subunit G